MIETPQRWTLEDLCSRVALALSVDYDGQPNGQVSDIPNARTIRYYTTLGLLDRAAAFEGRTALYGERHLMQVTAIKRLQARGLTLAEVQERLTGASELELADWAQLPPAALESCDEAMPATSNETVETPAAAVQRAFWLSEPSEPEPARPAARPPTGEPVPTTGAPAGWLVGLPLAAGAVLLLEPGRSPDEDDWRALEVAAAPLLKLLRQRGLLKSPTPGRTER